MSTLTVTSYNVKGLHSPIKRKKVLLQLRQLKCHVALLQETHLSDAEHQKLNKSWADKVYFSSHCSGRKRGVAILIHRQINFTETLVHKDREGRFLLVNGIIDGTAVSFINVYAPNEDVPGFIKSVFNMVAEYSSGLLIMGGDFNCVMSNLDRQSASQSLNMKISQYCPSQSLIMHLLLSSGI